jgi:hypothetical protein
MGIVPICIKTKQNKTKQNQMKESSSRRQLLKEQPW